MSWLKSETLSFVLVTVLCVLKSTLAKELVNAAFNVVPGGQTLSHVETWVSI